MTNNEGGWIERFYDVLEWCFWTPSNMGRKPDPAIQKKGWGPVEEKMKRTEEPLNLILRLLFSTAPAEFSRRLSVAAFGERWDEEFELCGRDFEERFSLPANSTQPDFAFYSQTSILTVEMKTGTKTSYDQLAKYAYFHHRAETTFPRCNKHGLIYLAKRDWDFLWPGSEKLDIEGRRNMAAEHIPDRVGISGVKVDRDTVLKVLETMKIGFLSYDDLSRVLCEMSAEVTSADWRSDILNNLLLGVVEELKHRRLLVD